jgi:hypothetical protein
MNFLERALPLIQRGLFVIPVSAPIPGACDSARTSGERGLPLGRGSTGSRMGARTVP